LLRAYCLIPSPAAQGMAERVLTGPPSAECKYSSGCLSQQTSQGPGTSWRHRLFRQRGAEGGETSSSSRVQGRLSLPEPASLWLRHRTLASQPRSWNNHCLKPVPLFLLLPPPVPPLPPLLAPFRPSRLCRPHCCHGQLSPAEVLGSAPRGPLSTDHGACWVCMPRPQRLSRVRRRRAGLQAKTGCGSEGKRG